MSLIPAPRRSTCAIWEPLLKNKQNFTEIPLGCCLKDPCLGAIFWDSSAFEDCLTHYRSYLGAWGSWKEERCEGGGGRWVTLCLVPTRFCIPSPTIKSPRTSTKYYNSDVDFPEQEEWFLRHTRYSAKLILFYFYWDSNIKAIHFLANNCLLLWWWKSHRVTTPL